MNLAAQRPVLFSQKPAIEWDLSRVVRELRLARGRVRQEHEPARARSLELPSRSVLADVMDGLRAALFPTHYGQRNLSEESVDYFVGHTLDATLGALLEQVRCELRHRDDSSSVGAEQHAIELTRELAAQLPRVRALLQGDLQAALDGDPAATSIDEVLFCYPGMTAVTNHRVAHALHRLGAPLLARIIAELAHSETGIDIHPGAQIGESFFIDHGTGVVIGETSVIGARVRLYQGVTLGAKSFPVDARGVLIKGAPRHPIIQDDVVIYAGATVLGRITIGRGSSIGGNVWITHSVGPNSRVTQHQTRSGSFGGGAGI